MYYPEVKGVYFICISVLIFFVNLIHLMRNETNIHAKDFRDLIDEQLQLNFSLCFDYDYTLCIVTSKMNEKRQTNENLV